MSVQSPSPAKTGQTAMIYIFVVLSLVGFVFTPYMIFQVAKIPPQMGFSQKIFYYHVPCAWVMLIASILGGIGGWADLFKKKPWGRRLLVASTEMTLLFGALVLVTGPLWARLAWGHYWVWDVRLTTMLMLFLIYLGVQLCLNDKSQSSRKIASGLALFGAVDAPIIYFSVKVAKTIHPKTSVVPSLDASMRGAFWLSILTFLLLFIVLLIARMRVAKSEEWVEELRLRAEDKKMDANDASEQAVGDIAPLKEEPV